jgi:hypothetical protein
MKRFDIINALIKKNNYKTYLEIGVRDKECFNQIIIDDKKGCDPLDEGFLAEFSVAKSTSDKKWKPSEIDVDFRMTSDEYFKNHNHKYDII